MYACAELLKPSLVLIGKSYLSLSFLLLSFFSLTSRSRTQTQHPKVSCLLGASSGSLCWGAPTFRHLSPCPRTLIGTPGSLRKACVTSFFVGAEANIPLHIYTVNSWTTWIWTAQVHLLGPWPFLSVGLYPELQPTTAEKFVSTFASVGSYQVSKELFSSVIGWICPC